MHATADGPGTGHLRRPSWPDPPAVGRVLSFRPPDDSSAHDSLATGSADERVIGLYESEYTGIARLAYLLVGDRHRAEDLAHDAFVRLYEHWDEIADADKALAWLRSTVSNLAMSSHRRAKTARKHQHTVSDMQDGVTRSAESVALARSSRPDVVAALQTLSPKQRTAVVLKHWLRMTEGEISEAIGCSIGSTRTHISRGHEKLASKLGGHR